MNHKYEQEEIKSLADLKTVKKRSKARSRYLEKAILHQISATKEAFAQSIPASKNTLLNPIVVTGVVSAASQLMALKSAVNINGKKNNTFLTGKVKQIAMSFFMKLLSRYLTKEKIIENIN